MKKSFMKKIEIKTFIDAIDKYRNMLTNVTFTKNFGILEVLVEEKTAVVCTSYFISSQNLSKLIKSQ